MNLDDLRLIQVNERRSEGLQELERDFYGQVRAYIKALEEDKRNVEASQAMKIDDELRSVRSVIEGIFNRRIGKIVKMASLRASGSQESPKGVTPEELDLFEQLTDLISRSRAIILNPVIRPKLDKSESSLTLQPPSNVKIRKEFKTVRVLEDIPVFVGADGRNYQLSKEDLIVLPKANSKILCDHHVAIPVKIGSEDYEDA
jgi:DNA replication factor GINS